MSDSHDSDQVTTRTRKDAAVTSQAADAGLASPAGPRRFRRRRGGPDRGARGRKVTLAAAAADALAAALLGAPPAHAGGYQCNLRFYYNVDGSPDWPGAQAHPVPARPHGGIPCPDWAHPRTPAAAGRDESRPFSICSAPVEDASGIALAAPSPWRPAGVAAMNGRK